MPPLDPEELEAGISEDEIPARNPKVAAKEEAMAVDEEEEDGDDEDEYVVEKILSHRKKNKTILYKVKWLGYEEEEDQTEEPEENLENAQELVDRYWETLGGREAGKGKKRKISNINNDTPKGSRGRKKIKESEEEDAPTKKRARKYPEGSWEMHIACIDTLEEKLNPTTGEMEKKALVSWNDSTEPRKTMHDLDLIRKKAPHKLIDYFIQHLVFKTADDEPEANGETVD